MRLLTWLTAPEAANLGAALADDFVLRASAPSATKTKEVSSTTQTNATQAILRMFMQRVHNDVRPMRLNFFARARLANSFKWRLREKGVEPVIADELTQALVVEMAARRVAASHNDEFARPSVGRGTSGVQALIAKGDKSLAARDYAEAMSCYHDVLAVDPRNAKVRNNLGGALWQLGRYKDAEDQFRRAIDLRPTYVDAHCNLGSLLRVMGHFVESETALRRAVKLKPTHQGALSSLGLTLLMLARVRDAKSYFEKVLRVSPRDTEALGGMAQVATFEGRFQEAEAAYQRLLELEPKAHTALAALANLRKMTAADRTWLKRAEEVAADGLAPLDEAGVHYAIGKYHDDLGEFGRAFASYRRANELQKSVVDPYDKAGRSRFVDDLLRVWTSEHLTAVTHDGASSSERPVFVVGMPRSGTSLIEQIIASHPAAKGAGELGFWPYAVRKHESVIRTTRFDAALTGRLATSYLHVLEGHSPDASRVVDKAPFNSDHLGIIHAVFPHARMIYVRRDPIDTCLSCYFQKLTPTLNFTMDLSELAHYYREHYRLIEHWRAVLPARVLLDVPYGELIADPEKWARRIVDFLGLEWDPRCLDFHQTQRAVVTASYWQVRQQIYRTSVGRWRNYEKFIGPLLSLKGME